MHKEPGAFGGKAQARLNRESSKRRALWYAFGIAFLIFCYYVLQLARSGPLIQPPQPKQSANYLFTELAIEKDGKALISETFEASTDVGIKHGISRLLRVRMHGAKYPDLSDATKEESSPEENETKEADDFKLHFTLLGRSIMKDGVELGGINHPAPIPFRDDKLVLLGDPAVELDPGKYNFSLNYRIENFTDALKQNGGFYYDLGRVFSFTVGIYKARVLLPPHAALDNFSVEMFMGKYNPETGLIAEILNTVPGKPIPWEESNDPFYTAQQVHQVVFELRQGIQEEQTVLLRIRDLSGFLSLK